jgi:hypothetical protein
MWRTRCPPPLHAPARGHACWPVTCRPHPAPRAACFGSTRSRGARPRQVWNPGFDVTPAELIQGIITERGVIERGPGGAFDVRGFMAARGLLPDAQGAPSPAAA